MGLKGGKPQQMVTGSSRFSVPTEARPLFGAASGFLQNRLQRGAPQAPEGMFDIPPEAMQFLGQLQGMGAPGLGQAFSALSEIMGGQGVADQLAAARELYDIARQGQVQQAAHLGSLGGHTGSVPIERAGQALNQLTQQQVLAEGDIMQRGEATRLGAAQALGGLFGAASPLLNAMLGVNDRAIQDYIMRTYQDPAAMAGIAAQLGAPRQQSTQYGYYQEPGFLNTLTSLAGIAAPFMPFFPSFGKGFGG